MDSELLRCTAAMLTVLSKAATQCDTLHRTLSRFLNRHPYSDTLNRPTSIGHAAAIILLVGNTQLPTDSAEEPKVKSRKVNQPSPSGLWRSGKSELPRAWEVLQRGEMRPLTFRLSDLRHVDRPGVVEQRNRPYLRAIRTCHLFPMLLPGSRPYLRCAVAWAQSKGRSLSEAPLG